MVGLALSQAVVIHTSVGWQEILSDAFAGIAAAGALAVVWLTTRYARSTLKEMRSSSVDSHQAHMREIAARESQLAAEIRHQRLIQTQRIAQLTCALAMIRAEPETAGEWRYVRYTAVRLETIAALRLLDLLGGHQLPKCKRLAEFEGLRPVEEINDVQSELVAVLEAELGQPSRPVGGATNRIGD
jgi:hypothetical protein